MKLLTIGNSLFSIPGMNGNVVEYYIPKNLEETLEFFMDKGNSLPDLIIIQAEQIISSSTTESVTGLELLIWLRIKGIKTHILLSSFDTLQTVLKKTKYAFVLGTQGCSFSQMPFTPTANEVNEMAKSLSEDKNFKNYLSSIFDIAHFRHVYANVWGLKRLIEVHEEINLGTTPKIKLDESIIATLDYKIAEFLFADIKGGNTLNQYRDKSKMENTLEDLQTMNDGKIGRQRIRFGKQLSKILLIDDKANLGWKDFLQLLMPHFRFIELPIKNNINDLIVEFERLYNEDEVLMVILDLRLLLKEEHEHDYTKLLSVQLFQRMLDKRNKSRDGFMYPHLKFLLFTASNQLKNMLDVMYINDHTPYRIFIKEGFDMNQSESQKYDSYRNLLYCLEATAKENYRDNPKKLESFSLNEQNKIDNFNEMKSNGQWQKKHDELITKYNLTEYTHVILDTNIFSDEQPILPLTADLKIILIYPVFKELKRWTFTRRQTYRKFCAEYFLNLYENNVDRESLKNDIIKIDALFGNSKNNLNDAADGYFKEALKYYQRDLGNKILFVTNDITAKKGIKPPLDLVQEWITTDCINNVVVCCYDNKNNEFVDAFSVINSRKKPKSYSGKASNTHKTSFSKKSTPPQIHSKPYTQSNIVNNKPKAKWKDCMLLDNGYELTVELNANPITIIIGTNFRVGFKIYFEKLKNTEEEMELKFNGETKKYNIENISVWINKAKKL